MTLVFSQIIFSPIFVPNGSMLVVIVCIPQRVTKRRDVFCKIQVRQTLLTLLDANTVIVLRFSHAKVDDDKEK